MIEIKKTVLNRLEESKPNWEAISKESGVPFHTLKKIGSGVTKNPGIDHIERLYNFFNK